jgi:hypothetical protein
VAEKLMQAIYAPDPGHLGFGTSVVNPWLDLASHRQQAAFIMFMLLGTLVIVDILML